MRTDGKYSLLDRDNLKQRIQIQLSQKQKTFSHFFLHFWNLVQIWNIFKKNMTLMASVFSKLRTPKNMVRYMPKKSHFRTSVEKQHIKCPQILLKFEGQLLYHIFWSLENQLSCKKALLVICKISKLFPNILTADRKYSLLERDSLTQQIQMQLFQKQKTFSQLFSSFLKSRLNLEHLQTKDDTHSWCISAITDYQKHG